MPLGSGPPRADLTLGERRRPTRYLGADADRTCHFMDVTVKRRVLLLQLLETMISREAVKRGDANLVRPAGICFLFAQIPYA